MNKELYKFNPLDNMEGRRREASQKLRDQRHQRRTTDFNRRRNLNSPPVVIQKESPKKEIDKAKERKIALQKFVAQKEAAKKALTEKKRPPFIVGIPHHGSSPILRNITNSIQEKTNKPVKIKPPISEVRHQRVTRAAALRAGQINPHNHSKARKPSPARTFPFKEKKSVFAFESKKIMSIKKLTSPHTPTCLKRSAKKNIFRFNQETPRIEKKKKKVEQSVENTHTRQRNKNVITEEKENPLTPQDDEIPRGRSPDQRDNAAVIEQNEATLHRSRLDTETSRLLALAVEWESRALQEKELPRDIQDEIDSVVGNTKLLTRDKFNQFRGLIEQFEQEATHETHKITNEDLNGFWEMMYLQVEKLNEKYQNLETLKNNDWVQPEPVRKKRRAPAKQPKSANTVREPVPSEKAQPAIPTPAEGDLQTPITEKHRAVSRVSGLRRVRSNSPASFITMRLSNAGRLSAVGMDQSKSTPVTPTSILNTKVKTEPKSTEGRTILFSTTTLFGGKVEIPDQNEETTFSEIKTEPEETHVFDPLMTGRIVSPVETDVSDPQMADGIPSIVQVLMKTPRRSMRLLHKTPSQAKACSPSPLFNSGGKNKNTLSKPSTSAAKFTLKPSNLLVEGITNTAPSRTRNSRRVKDIQS